MEVFVDIHGHPHARPFGQSQPGSKHNANLNHTTNVRHHDPPMLLDKPTNFTRSLTRFRQSDLTASGRGNVRVLVNSPYPLKRGFCRNKLGTNIIADLPLNFSR